MTHRQRTRPAGLTSFFLWHEARDAGCQKGRRNPPFAGSESSGEPRQRHSITGVGLGCVKTSKRGDSLKSDFPNSDHRLNCVAGSSVRSAVAGLRAYTNISRGFPNTFPGLRYQTPRGCNQVTRLASHLVGSGSPYHRSQNQMERPATRTRRSTTPNSSPTPL